VPVFFNDPTSLLQKSTQSYEYNHILDDLNVLNDRAQRMAYMAVYCASMSTIAERNVSKPFNPLLGETFEHETDEFECVAEQVSHHPPITANYCRGKKTNYTFWNNQLSKTKFTGKCVDVHH
jgi:hypothetical protein